MGGQSTIASSVRTISHRRFFCLTTLIQCLLTIPYKGDIVVVPKGPNTGPDRPDDEGEGRNSGDGLSRTPFGITGITDGDGRRRGEVCQ